MTEAERIVNKNPKLAKFDLGEEHKLDTYISEKMKKIWLIELDLLTKFDEVCKKYNLKYYLAYGSLLGAIRHNGYIPWDDDLDLFMLRDDYDILCTLGNEFKDPYFLQTTESDGQNDYYCSFLKLRNSNTTFISDVFEHLDFNMGIFIDVFCIDNWNEAGGEETFNLINTLIIDNSNYMRSKNPNPSLQEKERILNYSGNNPNDNNKKLYELETSYRKTGDELCVTNFTRYGYKKNIFKKSWFDMTIMWNFMGLKFPIPSGYDAILKKVYGDYKAIPPMEERGIWHKDIKINPDIGYKEYKSGV